VAKEENMRKWLPGIALVVLALAVPSVGAADDLTGQQEFLCTAVQVHVCNDDGECMSDQPWDLNIPQFIEVNLKDKKLSTTKASGEARSTPIKNMERADGLIALQGFEMGRAFSFLITEKTGMLVVSVAREGKTVSVFGACTPMAASK
jgi:hypothetical protein